MDYGRDYDRSSYASLATMVEEEQVVTKAVVATKAVKPVAVAAAAPAVPAAPTPAKSVSKEIVVPVSVPSINPSTSMFDALIGNTKKSSLGNYCTRFPSLFVYLRSHPTHYMTLTHLCQSHIRNNFTHYLSCRLFTVVYTVRPDESLQPDSRSQGILGGAGGSFSGKLRHSAVRYSAVLEQPSLVSS